MPNGRRKKARTSSVTLTLISGLGAATSEFGILWPIEVIEEEPVVDLNSHEASSHHHEPSNPDSFMDDDDDADGHQCEPVFRSITSNNDVMGETLIPSKETQLADAIAELEVDVDFPPLLGFHGSPLHSDLVHRPPQTHADMDTAILNPHSDDVGTNTLPLHNAAHEGQHYVRAPSSDLPSTSSRVPAQQDTQNMLKHNDTTKSQWNQLFADNRKPLDDYMLKKGSVPSLNVKQQIWRPKRRPKNTTFIRVPTRDVPVANASASVAPKLHTNRDLHDMTVASNQDQYKMGTSCPGSQGQPDCIADPSTSPPGEITVAPSCPGLMGQPDSTANPSPSPPHVDPGCLQPVIQIATSTTDSEGFKKVVSKRHQRNLRSQKNPEHHTDKPKDKGIP
ncbi:hypothetical protein Dimus_007522 [Dionaea muscipula]